MGSHVDMSHQTQLSLLKVTVIVLAIYINSIASFMHCIYNYIPGPYSYSQTFESGETKTIKWARITVLFIIFSNCHNCPQ